MECSSHERVRLAPEHKEPDRVPFDLEAAAVTGINVWAPCEVTRHLGLPGEVKLGDTITQLATADGETADYGRHSKLG